VLRPGDPTPITLSVKEFMFVAFCLLYELVVSGITQQVAVKFYNLAERRKYLDKKYIALYYILGRCGFTANYGVVFHDSSSAFR